MKHRDTTNDVAKARTFERIINHLRCVIKTEPRRREKMRANIAIRNIGKWYTEEMVHIEKQTYTGVTPDFDSLY